MKLDWGRRIAWYIVAVSLILWAVEYINLHEWWKLAWVVVVYILVGYIYFAVRKTELGKK